MSINRRTVLAVLSIAPLAVPSADAAVGNPTIAEVFALWWVNRCADYTKYSDHECELQYAEYARLQELISTLTPVTATDLAMQIIAETDNCDSEWRATFEAGICKLAGL